MAPDAAEPEVAALREAGADRARAFGDPSTATAASKSEDAGVMSGPSPRWIAPVPNLLSALRIALAAAFPFVPVNLRLLAMAAAGVSDVLDGWVARRFHAVSELGRLLDGIADKAFVLSAVGTLVAEGTVPWWAGVLAMARDVTVAAIAAWCVAKRAWGAFREMRPRPLGKATTAAAFLWFATILVPELSPVRWPALALAAMTSVGAAIDYAAQFSRRRRDRTRPA